MPERRATALLNVQLWSLRAEVEALLRCLTKVHSALTALPPPTDATRQSSLDALVLQLNDFVGTCEVVRRQGEVARDEAQALAQQGS